MIKFFVTLLIMLLNSSQIAGQLTGKLTYSPEEETYLISVIPNQTLLAPKNITNTGQITLKTTSGTFNITAINSITGIWSKAATINSPIESPSFDYHVFILGTPITNPKIEAGTPIPLFSFQNNKEDCNGSIELIENFSDAFWPPNSNDVNIGNQLTVLGFGFDNAYANNDEFDSKIECLQNLALKLVVDTLKCSADSTTFSIEILSGELPFIYTLTLENGNHFKDSLTQINTTQLLKLPIGNHSLTGFDQSTRFTQMITINSPPPLRIDILEKENISCHHPTGTILVQGSGGLANSFQYNWSNGAIGPQLNQLPQGFYEVTLTDLNNCSTIKSIFIEELPKLRIDSIEMYPPTCNGAQDGIIEMVGISHGTPPFQYAIADKPFQKDNYFDNLPGGTYQVYVTDAENCVTTNRVTLYDPDKLGITNIQKDTFLKKGEQLHLKPIIKYDGPLSYDWTPKTYLSCSDCPNPITKPSQTITYQLIVSNLLGCEASIENTINVLDKTPIYLPNIFKPTSNGDNKHFTVFIGPTIQQIKEFQIFNRWGQLIYTVDKVAPNQNISWDGYYKGKIAESDIYIYVVVVLLKNNKTEIFKGDFFLNK